jgi:hypothetical protein
MPMKYRFCVGASVLISVGLLIAGCHHRAGSRVAVGEQGDSAVGFLSLYKSRNGGPPAGVREVIRDSIRWRQVWNATCCSVSAVVPIPRVDFTNYMVLLAGDSHSSGGDSVVIDQVTETAALVRVRVQSYQHCHPIDVVTRPVHLVRISRTKRKVVFDNQAIRGPNCI